MRHLDALIALLLPASAMATVTDPLTEIHQWEPPGQDYIFDVAWSPDGRYLAAGDEQYNLLVYDMVDPTNPTLVQRINMPDEYVLSVDWSMDGRYVAAGTEDFNAYVYDSTDSYNLAYTLTDGTDYINEIRFSPDGSLVATCDDDGNVFVYAYPGFTLSYSLTVPTDAPALAWAPDSQSIAVACDDNEVYVFSGRATGFDTRQIAMTFNDDARAVAYSKDGVYLAGSDEEGVFKVVMAATFAAVTTNTDGNDYMCALAFSPEGRYLVTGDEDYYVRVYDVQNGWTKIQEIIPATDYINSVEFSPDGLTLAVGSEDYKIYLYSLPPHTTAAPTAAPTSNPFGLPNCMCENFRNGLTTDHVGEQACARNEVHGFNGVVTKCSMPERPFIPMIDDGCPSDQHRCIARYTPPVWPSCTCAAYASGASPTTTDGLCQKNDGSICVPRDYVGDKKIGGEELYGCANDMHYCVP